MLRLHFGAHQYPGFWLLKVRQEDGSSRLAVCSICDFECFNRQQMFDHLQLKHNHLGCFPCTESDCQETFVYRDDRNYHLHVSHNRECFIATALAAGQKGQRPGDVCLFCALDYKSPSELVKHVVTMHVVGRGNLITDGSVDIWICSTCGLCFNDQTDLGVHVKNHRLQTALRVTSGFKEGLSHFRFVVECEMGKTLEIYCGMCRENLNRGASAVSHFLEKHAGPHRWQIERLHSSTASNPMKVSPSDLLNR